MRQWRTERTRVVQTEDGEKMDKQVRAAEYRFTAGEESRQLRRTYEEGKNDKRGDNSPKPLIGPEFAPCCNWGSLDRSLMLTSERQEIIRCHRCWQEDISGKACQRGEDQAVPCVETAGEVGHMARVYRKFLVALECESDSRTGSKDKWPKKGSRGKDHASTWQLWGMQVELKKGRAGRVQILYK
ncbi:hypothetical protein WA026_005363 [Henosepilachna vigintioctopunctata]|uniref:Uncharacterized protein n=1 Tax=Henosepilachna vigintioctopunctata TaxID=420089 RepID=A0AAW1TUQ0_9CUCU